MANFGLNTALENRTVSSFPLSIPTGMAFESLFTPRIAPYDPERKIPNKVLVHDYQTMYINVWTLFRNLMSSLEKVSLPDLASKDISYILNLELETIESLFSNEGGGVCKPIFYFCSYDKLYNGLRSKDVRMRTDKTSAQVTVKKLFMDSLKELFTIRPDILKLDSDLDPKERKSLIMTHVPYDLTSYKKFDKLDLLESHTGVLKSRSKWSSKYYPIPGEDISFFPFLRKLLLILGDKVLIQPSDIRLRRIIFQTAKKRNWNQTTTLEKVMMDLELEITEPFVMKYIREL